jgi:hypothetical protein
MTSRHGLASSFAVVGSITGRHPRATTAAAAIMTAEYESQWRKGDPIEPLPHGRYPAFNFHG